MKLGIAILKTNKLDGIEITDEILLGKQYLVNLHSITKVDWFNEEFKYGRKIEAIIDMETGGFLPLELLELRGCIVNSPSRN